MKPDHLRALTNRVPLPRGFQTATRFIRALQAKAPDAAVDRWMSVPAGRFGTLAINLANSGLWTPYYLTGALERSFTRSPLARLIHSLLPPDGWFVDVGANIGLYTLLAAQAALSGRVLALEPEPTVFAVLGRNIALNHLSNVERFPVALTDTSGPVRLSVHRHNYGGHSLVGSADTAGTVEVAGLTFSDFLRPYASQLDAIRLIKIDVEGAEAAVVRGLTGALAGGWKPVIHCEVRGLASARAPNSALEVSTLLAKHGYRPTRLGRGGRLRIVSPGIVRSVGDLTFVPDGAPLALK